MADKEGNATLELLVEELTNRGLQNQMVGETKTAELSRRNSKAQLIYDSSAINPDYLDSSVSHRKEDSATRIITNDVVSEYMNIAGNSRRVIGTLPAGAKVLSTKNANITIDPQSGKQVVTAPEPVIVPAPSMRELASRIYAQEQGATPMFDVDKAIRDITNKQGEEKGIHALQVISNIDTEYAKRMSTLSTQARIQAGIPQKEAAVQMLTQAAMLKRLDPSSVIEVVNAQAALSIANREANAAITLLPGHDADLIKLHGSRVLINTMLQKTFAEGEREQAMTELVTTDTMLFNHRVLTGDTGDGFKDRLMAFKMAAKDPTYKALIGFDVETAPSLLTHIDAGVRAKAMKMLTARDKAYNPYNLSTQKGIKDDATSTPVSEMIAEAVKADIPTLISTYHKGKGYEKMLADWTATTGKERLQASANIRANLIPKIVEDAYEKSWQNATKWVGTNTMPGQPLGKVIADVAAARKGVAPMDEVIISFIGDDTIKGPDGKPLDIIQRRQILESTINDTGTVEAKSILFQDPKAVVDKIQAQVRMTADRAFITKQMSDAMKNFRSMQGFHP